MCAKEKAENIVHHYRMLLMNEDTECGEEILVSMLSKQCALIAVDEILEVTISYDDISKDYEFWKQVKQEIEKL